MSTLSERLAGAVGNGRSSANIIFDALQLPGTVLRATSVFNRNNSHNVRPAVAHSRAEDVRSAATSSVAL